MLKAGWQVQGKWHGGYPPQELHAQIRKGSWWTFPPLDYDDEYSIYSDCMRSCCFLIGTPCIKHPLVRLTVDQWFAHSCSLDSMTTWTIWPARVPNATELMWHLKGFSGWLSQDSHTTVCHVISETGTQQQVAGTRCCCLHVPRGRFQDLTFKLWQSDCLSTWNANR